MDVDMLKSSDKSYNEGGGALCGSQSANIVSLLAGIHNTFLDLLPPLNGSSSVCCFLRLFFSLQE